MRKRHTQKAIASLLLAAAVLCLVGCGTKNVKASADYSNTVSEEPEAQDIEQQKYVLIKEETFTENGKRLKGMMWGHSSWGWDTAVFFREDNEVVPNGAQSYYTYQYDQEGNMVERVAYSEEDVAELRTVVEYDREGRIVKTRTYYVPGNTLGTGSDRAYDGRGSILSIITNVYFLDQTDKTEYGYRYDEDGRIAYMWIKRDPGGSSPYAVEYEFEYDDHGSLLRVSGSEDIEYSYIYNEKGNVIQKEVRDWMREEHRIIQYEYDDSDRVAVIATSISYDDSSPELLQDVHFTYDEHGNRTRADYYSYEEEAGAYTIYTYAQIP